MTTGPGLDFYYPSLTFFLFHVQPHPHGLDGFICLPTPDPCICTLSPDGSTYDSTDTSRIPLKHRPEVSPLNLPLSHLHPPLPLLPFLFSASAISGYIPSTTISRLIPLILLYEYIFGGG